MVDSKIVKMSLKIKELYEIVNDLEECFPGRHFTPDCKWSDSKAYNQA